MIAQSTTVMGKQRARCLAGLPVVVLATALIIVTRRGQLRLLEIASRLSESNIQAYAWESDRKLVMVSKPGKEIVGFPQAFRKDADTGVQHPLSDLTLKLEAWSTEGVADLHVSPDGSRLAFQGANDQTSVWWVKAGLDRSNVSPFGRRLLERSRYYSPFGRRLPFDRIPVARMLAFGCVTELDGSHYTAWEDIGGLGGIWMPDSRSWLSLTQKRIAEGVTCSQYSIRGTGLSRKDLQVPVGIRALLGVTSGDRVIATNFSPVLGTLRNHVDFYELDTRAQPAYARKFTLRLPPGAELSDLALSPGGDRLAWYFVFAHRESRIEKLLAQWFPFLSRRLHGSAEAREGSLWVSRLDGRDMHEIGSHDVAPPASSDRGLLSDLRWTPDGKRLSFLYRQSVWTVPAQ